MDHKKLALIHIIKKELGLSDPEYRAILKEAAGVTTAKDLDEAKFRRLMKYFVRSRLYRDHPDAVTLRQKMFIKALFQDLGWEETHARNFLRKFYHQDDLSRLTKAEASHVIESLKHIKSRHSDASRPPQFGDGDRGPHGAGI